MKVNIEIDCTPEEARQFMGLPDVERANDVYVDAMVGAMKGENNMEQLEKFASQIAPMGQLGMKMFQNFMESAVAQATTGEKPKDSGKSES